MNALSADYEGDCYTDPVSLHIGIGKDKRAVVSITAIGEVVWREQQLIDLAKTHSVFISDTQTWNILKYRYPEAYTLIKNQLDSMIVASRWWSPVHVLNLLAADIPETARDTILTGWLALSGKQQYWKEFVRLYKSIKRVERFMERREG